ncbi:MAG: methionine--tRNA ligase [Candidatus Magasanikbacteria bacterium]|nr:methionine--tRNA ligase [Candidatus Magasanikbacteria bacterium]
MPKKNTFYLTTAIAYANAAPHIGFALELLYSDVMCRYQRLIGKEVFFLTGTDEHGQKIFKAAEQHGQDSQSFTNEQSAKFSELADLWNISNNDFIRTTEARHKIGAQKFWLASMNKGDIYKKTYTGLYCVGCESFKTEKDLVDGLCPDHKKAPEILEEENYFFRLSNYQKQLEELFEKNRNFIVPASRFNEMYNILKNGLEDISVSRSKDKLPWGIGVPNDPTQVMYVWFDALTNYITALGYGSDDETNFNKFWPAVHVIGKEINRFHSLLWPAMLLSAGLETPKQIAVHGWMTVDGQKMSKTVGNVINPAELTAKYQLEAIRYFLMREIPFNEDGDFSSEKFRERYTADLANGLGNFTSRVLTMVEKYCDNQIPAVENIDENFINFIKTEIWPNYIKNMDSWNFVHAYETVWKLVATCDQIISDKKPWSLAKEGRLQEVKDLLYHLCEALRQIAVMIYPVMPETSEKLIIQLGLDINTEFSKKLSDLQQWVDLTVGNKINKGEILFPRL